jgi:hypothetical protein
MEMIWFTFTITEIVLVELLKLCVGYVYEMRITYQEQVVNNSVQSKRNQIGEGQEKPFV